MTTSLLARPIEEYAEQFTTPESTVLAALNRETHLKRGDSVMLSGHLQGEFLQMLAHMIQPKCILEIGTFTGYSAICLALGLQNGGHLHTIEIDEELQDIASKYISKAGLRDKITQHIGKADEVIASLNETDWLMVGEVRNERAQTPQLYTRHKQMHLSRKTFFCQIK